MRKQTKVRFNLVHPMQDIVSEARYVFEYASKYEKDTQQVRQKLAVIIATANDLKRIFSEDDGRD